MVDARLFQALSDSTRLDILALLAGGTINVSRMVAHLGCAQPAVSRHLRVLREAQLITARRKGKEVEYSVNPGALAAAATYLGELVKAVPTAPPRPRRARVEPAGRRRVAASASARPAPAARQPSAERPRERPAERTAERRAEEPRTRPSGDFAPKEGEFVIGPRRKSGLDDFLL